MAATWLAPAALCAAPSAAPSSAPLAWIGTWEGALAYRGDTWPVRLAMLDGATGPQATLDLPELAYAWQPAPAVVRGDTLVITFPFGLAGMPLVATGDSLLATRAGANGNAFQLALHRVPAPTFVREDVHFRSGRATIFGDVIRPGGTGKHPAVVLVHGSGNSTRADWNYLGAADFFVRHGFVVLAYDKRGTGESKGAWMHASAADLQELGDDLREAVTFLRARHEVLIDSIGVFGGSQALWTIAIARHLGTPLAFVILHGAPAFSPEDQELQRAEATLRAANLPADDLAAALRHERLYFAVVRGDSAFAPLARSSAALRDKPWAGDVQLAERPDDLYWWKRNHAVDPEESLRSWRMPTLVMYGERDTSVPPEQNEARMAVLLSATDATLEVLPRADHALELPAGPDEQGQWRFPRKSPREFTLLESWLAAHGLGAPASR